MPPTDVFAGIPVADLAAMSAWYERLLGREPDMRPHDGEVCWQIAGSSWLYLLADEVNSGGSLVTIMVDDLDAELAAIRSRGIETPEVEEMKPARKCELIDPEGNRVGFGQPRG
jgi:catechol 2,3-dioxygenase-like lactoylglutathione lyase family enzyme